MEDIRTWTVRQSGESIADRKMRLFDHHGNEIENVRALTLKRDEGAGRRTWLIEVDVEITPEA